MLIIYGKLSLASYYHKPVPLLMNTNKQISLNNTQVERATQLFRAYKHPYRYEIINSLLMHGCLTAAELSSYIGMDEQYVLEQLDILVQSNLVLIDFTDDQLAYTANEPILLRMKNSVSHLA